MEMEIKKVNAIMQESSDTKSLVQVTEWINGEGFDIGIYLSSAQHISVTYAEFDIIKKAVKKLNKL